MHILLFQVFHPLHVRVVNNSTDQVVLDMGRMYIHNWLYLNYHVPAFHPDHPQNPFSIKNYLLGSGWKYSIITINLGEGDHYVTPTNL